MTLQVESPCVYTSQGVPISVTGIAQVKIQGQNEDMLLTACEQFLGKSETEIHDIALVTLEGHQRAIMGSMTVEEIYKDRKKFSKQVFEVASSDLVNMGITVVSYTIKDIRDEEVRQFEDFAWTVRYVDTEDGDDQKYETVERRADWSIANQQINKQIFKTKSSNDSNLLI